MLDAIINREEAKMLEGNPKLAVLTVGCISEVARFSQCANQHAQHSKCHHFPHCSPAVKGPQRVHGQVELAQAGCCSVSFGEK